MSKLSKEKRDKIILSAVGALALAGVFWYFVITAQNASREKYQQSIRDAQDKIYKAEMLIKRGASKQAELAELRQQIADAEAQMIPVEHLKGSKWLSDTLVNFITKNKHDVRLTNLSNDPVLGKQFLPLPKFAYSAAAYDLVEMQGYYHAFGKFLADFENSFPYIRIQKLQIWPLATPSAASGPTTDVPEELVAGPEREQLKIAMRVVVLFKPSGSP